MIDTNINARHISPNDLVALGTEHIAFIKAVPAEDGIVYTIHAADGTQMGVSADRDTAFAAVRQHGLEPQSVH